MVRVLYIHQLTLIGKLVKKVIERTLMYMEKRGRILRSERR